MATTFVACPSCGTQIHPIASRCKYCRCEVATVMPASPSQPEVAHAPRAAWMAVGLLVVGAATLVFAVRARYGTGEAEAAPVTPSMPLPKVEQPALEPAKPPATKWSALEGGWRGIGDQPDHGITWPVEIQFEKIAGVGSKVGTIKFGAPLGCSGELVREEDEDDTLVLHENITSDPDAKCVDEATIKLTKNGDKVDAVWIYTNGSQAASSTLTR
jgi:hypothetical protein